MLYLNAMVKKTAFIVLTLIPFIFGSAGCKKKEGCTNVQAANYDADAEDDNGTCQFNLLLWTIDAHDPIEIYLDSVFQDSLVQYRLDTVVNCNDSEDVFNKTLSPGSYALYARMDPFIEWVDTIQIDANCHKIKLEVPQ